MSHLKCYIFSHYYNVHEQKSHYLIVDTDQRFLDLMPFLLLVQGQDCQTQRSRRRRRAPLVHHCAKLRWRRFRILCYSEPSASPLGNCEEVRILYG